MKRAIAFVFIATLFTYCNNDNDNNNADHPCTVHATVRDLRGLDGCGYVFELDNGKKLEPLITFDCGTPPIPEEQLNDPLYDYVFVDGKEVYINYEIAPAVSICMVGDVVKITCITNASTQNHGTD